MTQSGQDLEETRDMTTFNRVKHELLRTRKPYLDYKQAKMNLKPSTIELLLKSDIKE